MKTFTTEPMLEILDWLQSQLKEAEAGKIVEFEVLDPDTARSTYAGETITIEDQHYIYRGYKAWVDLAELLFCRMLTPKSIPHNRIRIRFEKLDIRDTFHTAKTTAKEEKYGVESPFFSIHKTEEPVFLSAYHKALQSVDINRKVSVLDLGINSGDEFDIIKKSVDEKHFANMQLTGIDHSHSAINFAKKRFAEKNIHFHLHDINALDMLNLGRFDLIISVGTLQSPDINFKPFFMSLVQNYLTKEGAVILGFPNCRWMGGEMIYGAKAPNYAYSEMSLLHNDVDFCKRYLQQKKFRVTITGKSYIFLTATPIGRR